MNRITHIAKKFLLLGVVISLGALAYNASAAVEPYPQSSGSLISRVGSLVLAPSALTATLTSSYVNAFGRCEKVGNTGSATRTCLDVQGTGSFANLIANNLRAFFLDKTFIGPSDGAGPGVQTVPLFIADTGSGNDSMMVSDLGRFNVGGEFEPVDTTTMRGVCADANGEFFSCAVPDSPISTCPLTYTDQDNGVIYPIVDVDGACWFGRDLERNQMDATNAERIYDFVTDTSDNYEETSFAATSVWATMPGSGASLPNDDLLTDIAFLKNSEGTIRVAYASSGYLDIDAEFSDGVGYDGAYRDINPAFKSFLLNTCDWDADSMEIHYWSDGDEKYYVVDFQIAEHNDVADADMVKLRPTYNITCREYLGTDAAYATFDSLSLQFLDDRDFNSSITHMSVYTVDQPQVKSIENVNSGVFVHVEDLYDYTCPSGWHVPRRAEWSDLETAMDDRASDESVAFNSSTLATEMAFENTGSSNSYEWDDYGGRYYAREITEFSEPDYFSTSTYREVAREGYTLMTGDDGDGDGDGDVDFDLSRSVPWKKYISMYSINWENPWWMAALSQPNRFFVQLVDLAKIQIAHAALGGIHDGDIGKIRCVQGTELTEATGSWGACEDDGTGAGVQSYTVSSCTIGGNSVGLANCSSISDGSTPDGETRSCTLVADGGGGDF